MFEFLLEDSASVQAVCFRERFDIHPETVSNRSEWVQFYFPYQPCGAEHQNL